jgi:hypothetical protein
MAQTGQQVQQELGDRGSDRQLPQDCCRQLPQDCCRRQPHEQPPQRSPLGLEVEVLGLMVSGMSCCRCCGIGATAATGMTAIASGLATEGDMPGVKAGALSCCDVKTAALGDAIQVHATQA